ncbi:two-component regulator propeller domain-containing protein [Chitinophaga nivalis]|uniref:histidine kinase n=1 Tax=Chitinophaga nivalis TaxID=2991709 RepID=A0ABT3IJ43_9BACT|nr:two-component regulator propeller domain-containing protein [Chitinophaga nivalis]MCW3466327.1 histidine kinase [Chitinophaga nivalis]MCW3483982.1 histidine kinase [Chitinophaga nivalis]
MRCLCLLSCLLFCNYFPAIARPDFHYRYIPLPESLRDANINQVTPDSKGILWFFSSSGLHRYDGNQVLTFNLTTKPAILANSITCIFIDKTDHLWIATRKGLSRFDLKSWTTARIAPAGSTGDDTGPYITIMGQGLDGTIYVGTRDAKIYRVVQDELLLVADLGHLNPNEVGLASIESINEPVKGELWVVCNGRFVKLFPDAGRFMPPVFYPMKSLAGYINGQLYFAETGDIYFYLERKGIYIFNKHSGLLSRWQHPLNDSIRLRGRVFILPMGVGEMGLFINRIGFVTWNVNTRQCSEVLPIAPPYQRIFRVTTAKSHAGRTYLTLAKGVVLLEQQRTPFRSLLASAEETAIPQSIRCIHRHGNQLYMGSYQEGFIQVDEQTGEKKNIARNFIYTILPWQGDSLLLGSEGDGLLWYHTTKNTLQPFWQDTVQIPWQHRVLNKYTTALTRENDSLVWVGTYNGVYLLNVHTRTAHRLLPESVAGRALQQAKIFDILIAGKERYISTVEGLFLYRPESRELQRLFENTHPDYANESFYDILPVQDVFWGGTNGRGIVLFNRQQQILQEINTSNGLAGNAVYSLQRIGDDVIAATDQGLSIINLVNKQIKNYARHDQLPSNEFNHSAVCRYGNQVYLGTLNGIVAFNMQELVAYHPGKSPVNISFTSFTTGNKSGLQHDFTLPYQSAPALTVSPDIQYFSLRFGGVDPTVSQFYYYYRLNQEAPWQEVGPQQEIAFAGMAPGHYQLQLAARIPGQAVFRELLSIPLTVVPAFYQTWWFRMCVVLAAGVLVFLAFRYRMMQLLKEQQLRSKIAADLHDEVGSSLTRIYFQADMLSMQSGESTALQKIAAASKYALGMMSDMVWSIDARFDTAADLVSRIKDYLNNLQQELDITCVLELQGDYTSRALQQRVRQNFFLIFKEAMTNAARYTSTPAITVRLTFGATTTALLVCNHCSGDSNRMKNYQGGQGMANMQRRAAGMKGALQVSREKDRYCLLLQVPC